MGYENRLHDDPDFEDDTKDAGKPTAMSDVVVLAVVLSAQTANARPSFA